MINIALNIIITSWVAIQDGDLFRDTFILGAGPSVFVCTRYILFPDLFLYCRYISRLVAHSCQSTWGWPHAGVALRDDGGKSRFPENSVINHANYYACIMPAE